MSNPIDEPRAPLAPTRAASYLGGQPVSDSSAPSTPDSTIVTPFSGEALVDPGAGAAIASTPFEARYAKRAVLGKGGMGEVHLCRDHLIGRDVAMKMVRPGSVQAAAVPRFVREARIQGQLEHPAVVPVYDLGVGPDGETFFTMKRVRGMTLADVLAALLRDEPEISALYSRRRLLTAFSTVCLAVDFAHSRGVVHRDLKPSNVMLGDFGEVYLLDWGLAKLPAHPEPPSEAGEPGVQTTEIQTNQGALMGTPGYMSPEQMRGQVETVDAQSDVYALGCILFECLALEPLHPRRSPAEMIAQTLAGTDARPSVRAPGRDIPPELDAICVQATALDPRDRFANAREVHRAIERFLDGDRDHELRRQLAASHASAAARAAEEARRPGPGEHEARRQAMRAVGRALALDPENRNAMRTMVGLMVDLPREIPPEARAELEESERRQTSVVARFGGISYVALFAFIPFLFWMGIHDWTWMGACLGLGTAAIVVSLFLARSAPSRGSVYVLLALSTLAVISTAGMFGPFVLLPTLAVVVTIGFVIFPGRAGRGWFMVSGCLAILVPALLEWAEVWGPWIDFSGGVITIYPQMLALEETPTMVFLILCNLAIVVGSAWANGRVRDALTAAERRLHLQTWQLRQLLPEGEEPAAEAQVLRP